MFSSKHKIPVWAYVLFGLVIVVSIIYIISRSNTPIDGISRIRADENFSLVIYVRDGSSADMAGIKVGDKIYTNDSRWFTMITTAEMTEKPVGSTFQYVIDRNGESFTIPVKTESSWSEESVFYTILYISIFLLSFIGFFVLFKKPNDSSTKIFFVYTQLLALSFNSRWLGLPAIYSEIASSLFGFGMSVMGVSLIHFHLLFPHRSKLKINNKKFIVLLYITGIIIAAIVNYFHFLRVYYFDISVDFLNIGRYQLLWLGITLLLAFIIAFHQLRTTKEIIARNQLRWVIFGSIIGLSVIMLHLFYPDLAWYIEYYLHHNLFEKLNGFFSYIMIFCLLFAIFRYRLYDIEIILKKTLLYFSVTVSVLVVYFLAVYLIQDIIETEANLTRAFSVVISAGAFLSAKEFFQKRTDKLFHHEKYDPAKVVNDFEENLSGIYEPDILNNNIAIEINRIFGFKSFLLLLKKGEKSYEIVSSIGIKNHNKEIIIKSIEFEKRLLDNKVFATSELQEKSLFTSEFNAEIIIPLNNKDSNVGFFICGPKLSDFPYSMQDLQVLVTLARRTVSLLYTAELYRKELDKRLMIERERTRISRDMHDDIGSNLTRISILSELVKRKLSNSKEVDDHLEEISQSSRDIISNISEIIWAVNPANDSLDDLVSYLNHYSSKFLEGSRIKYIFIEPEQVPKLKLSTEQRRNIFLVVKEALNNALKYSEATEISLTVSTNSDKFSIIIKDNGRGFNDSDIKAGNGLINMRKRIEEVNGSFSISSTSESGAEIVIEI